MGTSSGNTPDDIMSDTLDAFKQSVGREPDAQEVVDIARVVSQEIKDNYEGGK